MNILKQSTSIVVRVGPFLDATDGVTPETGVTLGGADQAELLKAGGAATVDIAAATFTAVTGAGGWYDLTLTTAYTDTVGELVVVIQDASLCLPVFARFQVVEEAVYDAMFAASATGVPAAGATAAELAKVPKSDGTSTWNATALASINAECDTALADYDAPTNTEMAAAFTEIKGATWATTDTLEAIRDRGDAAWITATGFSTHAAADVWSVATRVLTASTNFNDPTAAAIADAVWDEVLSGHLTAGTTGASLNAAGGAGDPWTTTLPGSYTGSQAGKILADILTDTGTTIPATLTTIDGIVDDILVDTGTTIPGTITTLQGNVTDILTDTGTTIPATLATIDGIVDAILLDTAEIGAAGAGLTGVPWNAAWDAEVQSEVKDALDATVDDSVPADGTRPSVSAGIYMLCQYLFDTSISGTTMTVRKPDGSTTLFTVTLNDGTTPTAKTRGS